MKIALVNLPNGSGNACHYYRSLLPLRHCAGQLAREGIELVVPDPWYELDAFDAAVFYRAFSANGLAIPLKRFLEKKRTYWDVDDHMLAAPDWNATADGFDGLAKLAHRECLVLAHGVSVTTQELAAALGRDDDGSTVVLPNLADLGEWEFSGTDRRGPKVLLWAGAGYRAEDFRHVVPALRACRERDPELQIIFFGYCPDYVKEDLEIGVTYLGPVPPADYPRVMRFLAPDVVIAPLATGEGDLAFQRCKSPIKWVEGTLAGGAVVAQDLEPYRAVIEPGRNGWLCDTEDSWVGILPELLDRPRFAASLVRVATRDVHAGHVWQSEDVRCLWLDWFRRIAREAARE